MASLAKVRRLFLLLLLLTLLLTLLLLSRRVLKRTHHGRRRRRRNNGRRKKITRVVVVWIVVVSFNLFSFPSLLLLLSFQTLRASFSSLSLFRSLLLSFVFWCNREEEEDKEEEEEEEGFSLSLSLLFFWVPRGWKNITQEEEERINTSRHQKREKVPLLTKKVFTLWLTCGSKKKKNF